MISRKISYYPLSIDDILNFNSKKYYKKNLGVFITSSNNQQFLCYKNKDNVMEYNKIENNKYSIPKHIELILYRSFHQHHPYQVRKTLPKIAGTKAYAICLQKPAIGNCKGHNVVMNHLLDTPGTDNTFQLPEIYDLYTTR